MFGVNEAAGQFPEIKSAAVRVSMPEGTVVEVKAVYVQSKITLPNRSVD
jgi:hypothetical protein